MFDISSDVQGADNVLDYRLAFHRLNEIEFFLASSPCFTQVVFRLNPEPEVCGVSKVPGKPHSGISGDTSLFAEYFTDARRRHMSFF
jgi:hypothetical protein